MISKRKPCVFVFASDFYWSSKLRVLVGEEACHDILLLNLISFRQQFLLPRIDNKQTENANARYLGYVKAEAQAVFVGFTSNLVRMCTSTSVVGWTLILGLSKRLLQTQINSNHLVSENVEHPWRDTAAPRCFDGFAWLTFGAWFFAAFVVESCSVFFAVWVCCSSLGMLSSIAILDGLCGHLKQRGASVFLPEDR